MHCAGDYDALHGRLCCIALEIMMQCAGDYDAMRWRL